MDFLYTEKGTIMQSGTPFLFRGFGLGGWFLPEGYMWKFYTKCDRPRRMEALIEDLCGQNYAQDFWPRYLDHYITKRDMVRIRKEGFNSVRFPLNARHLFDEKEGVLSCRESAFARIDALIEWCRENDLYVILDMHGAPGGQTGQNIDDCEKDQPELFQNEKYYKQLLWLWREIALRYAKEPAVAGYDLLNEPLMNLFKEYNTKLLPLYRELIQEIRKVDTKHIIILEGAHWATDFSVFDDFTKEEAQDGIVLQFHHYWNNPDIESLAEYRKVGERLQVPLFMGEGGENNDAWYTTFFPMLERAQIGWSFWPYKKMDCHNSPMSFSMPKDWKSILDYLDGGQRPTPEKAREAFEQFLKEISDSYENNHVFHALNRKIPFELPAEAFDSCTGTGRTADCALFRTSESVSILFKNHSQSRKPDYKRYGGEAEPPDENLIVCLKTDEKSAYWFQTDNCHFSIEITAMGNGILEAEIENEKKQYPVSKEEKIHLNFYVSKPGKKTLHITCLSGTILLDTFSFM